MAAGPAAAAAGRRRGGEAVVVERVRTGRKGGVRKDGKLQI